MTGFDYAVYQETETETVTSLYTDDVETSASEQLGTLGQLDPEIEFSDERLSCEEEAIAYLAEHHVPGEPSLAVSFFVPGEATEEQAEKITEAREKVALWSDRLVKLNLGIEERFRGRTSDFVGCKGCGSRMAHERLLVNDPASVCPLCGASLAPRTDQNRRVKLGKRIEKAEAALALVSKVGPSESTAWVVGGNVESA